MGQAKLRGERHSRVAQALAKIEKLKPGYIICNNCQARLTEIVRMDSRGITGIEAAFAAHCSSCDHDTWAILGALDAVAAFQAAIEDETGTTAKIGVLPRSKE